MNSLFENLCRHYNVVADRRGEAHVDCPWCGKEAKRGQTHFSFSERGAHCWVCGRSSSLIGLAQKIEGGIDVPSETRYTPKRRKPRRWDVLDHGPRLFAEYSRHQSRWHLWSNYASAIATESIVSAHLGVGAYPQWGSKCRHERLQVPLLCNGKVVGFRGRALECGCDKWLGPAGNPSKFLYNGATLLPAQTWGAALGERCYIGDCHIPNIGERVWIVENPIDALLIAQNGERAVATLGVTIWHDAWTALLRGHDVLVTYDNDAPGNGGGQKGVAQWIAAHPGAAPPLNGQRLASCLVRAGIRAVAWEWREAPLKTDVGDLLRAPTSGPGSQ